MVSFFRTTHSIPESLRPVLKATEGSIVVYSLTRQLESMRRILLVPANRS